jgi:hypothetical protein
MTEPRRTILSPHHFVSAAASLVVFVLASVGLVTKTIGGPLVVATVVLFGAASALSLGLLWWGRNRSPHQSDSKDRR